MSSGLVGNAFSHSDVGGYTIENKGLALTGFEMGGDTPVDEGDIAFDEEPCATPEARPRDDGLALVRFGD